jgi:AmiR/NasT family two-component response regulator
MSSSVKIVFARKDLSIPGAPEKVPVMRGRSDTIEANFFRLVDDNAPDVIVIDCVDSPSAVTDTVLRVRRRTDVPIIVLCQPASALIERYRGAGVAACITSPVGFDVLNQSIQRIIAAGRPPSRAVAGGA